MQTLKALLLAATLLGGATTAHATGLLPDSGFDLLAPGDTGTNFTPDWSVNNNAASKNNGLSSPSEIFSALPNYQTPSKSAGLITQVSTIGMLSTNFTDTVVGGLNLTFWV